MKRNYTLLIYLLLITCIPTLNSCKTKTKADKDTIVVSIAPQRYFVKALAHDEFDILTMVGPGENPETYDPNPTQIFQLAQAKAYFRIGFIPFETTWMSRIKQNAPSLSIFNMAKGVLALENEHHDHNHEGHHHHSIDPHIWLSCDNAQKIAQNTVDALCKLNPKHKEVYKQRYDSLTQVIQQTDSIIRAQVAELPPIHKQFLIYHPALSYYAKEYGLHQIEIAHLGKTPTPSQLQEIVDDGKAHNIRLILIQEEFDQRQAESVAKMLKASVSTIYPLSENWQEAMQHIANTLNQAAKENNKEQS